MVALSIVVPAYNETGGIRPTLEQLAEAVSGVDCEILVVDDGSDDDTAAQAESCAGVRVLRHDVNRGYGAALKTGIRNARADVICITDADGTYPNDRIPELLGLMDRYDMVVGARTGANVAIPLVRRPAKWVLNQLANLLAGTRIPDLNSGLRLFRKGIAEKYMRFLPSGFSFTTTITMAMLNDDYLVKYVPIDYYHREGRSKIRPIRDTTNFVLLILRVTMYFKPLKIFLPVTLLLLLASAIAIASDFGSATGLSDKSVILSLATGMVFLVGLLADAVANR
ncbi:MAG: glycosyltransferase family 2 protein [Planctomycetota bacterium JB042]